MVMEGKNKFLNATEDRKLMNMYFNKVVEKEAFQKNLRHGSRKSGENHQEFEVELISCLDSFLRKEETSTSSINRNKKEDIARDIRGYLSKIPEISFVPLTERGFIGAIKVDKGGFYSVTLTKHKKEVSIKSSKSLNSYIEKLGSQIEENFNLKGIKNNQILFETDYSDFYSVKITKKKTGLEDLF